jgi:hypothetical protein
MLINIGLLIDLLIGLLIGLLISLVGFRLRGKPHGTNQHSQTPYPAQIGYQHQRDDLRQ